MECDPEISALDRAAYAVREVAQHPLYTIWGNGTWRQIFFAVVHCTAGDIVIAATALMLAALAVNRDWPGSNPAAMVAVLVAIGLGYTVYSEAYNLERGAWAYSGLMPRLPLLGVGLSPFLQWLLVPPLALYLTARAR